jgi:hypothetical protein
LGIGIRESLIWDSGIGCAGKWIMDEWVTGSIFINLIQSHSGIPESSVLEPARPAGGFDFWNLVLVF